MKLVLVAFCFVLAFSSFSHSRTCVKFDRNGHKIYYACPDGSEKSYNFQWNVTTTRTNGKVTNKEIITSTVCSKYGKGSVDYRRCRRQAQDLFETRCDSLGYDARLDKEMYCDAERAIKYGR